ncbi:hypothetical protein [Micromonospora avicenniae]|uniref:hypothetical protein n=1 Tax=Micromonospora avicenniae TaxID=1198245 RepID=UPI003323E1FD
MTDKTAEMIGAVLGALVFIVVANLILALVVAGVIAFAFSLPFFKTLAVCWLALMFLGWLTHAIRNRNN